MSNCVKKFPTKEFSTPPRTWNSSPCSPMPTTEKKRSSPPVRADSFHVIHKVPAGDSPYVKAKHVQLIEKDPSRAISLFWSSINSGDRVDSALKDMAIVMKQLNRADEAIEAIRSFRHLCPFQTQESLDNILIDLYKRCGRFEEQIQLLQHKLKLVEEGTAFGGKRTKIARSQGRKLHVTIAQEKSRLLGNLAWAYMQQNNYQTAEEIYRKALSIEPDKNKQCNLAVCLMLRGEIKEAKSLLQEIAPSTKDREVGDSYIKSFDRASEILVELESQSILGTVKNTEEIKDTHRSLTPINKNSKALALFFNDQNQGCDFLGCRKWEDENNQELVSSQVNSNSSIEKQKKISCSRNLFKNEVGISGFEKRRWGDETEFEGISAQNRTNTHGTSQPVSFQPRHDQQSYERPLYVDKWNKGVYSPRELESISGLPCSQDGRCSSERGIKEDSANNCTDKNVKVFDLTVSDHGDLKPKWTGAICSSKYPIRGDKKRSCGAECCTVTDGSPNTKLLIEQSVPIEKAHATPPQKLKSNSGDGDHRSETAVECIEGKNVGRNNCYVADNLSVSIITGTPKPTRAYSIFKSEKSWADMVEEEEEAEEALSTSKMEFMTNRETTLSQDSSVSFQTSTKWINECNYGESFHDENLNSNITSGTIPPCSVTETRPLLQLPPQNYAENLRQKLQAVDLKEGYSRSKGEVRNPISQRKWDSADNYCSASPKKGLTFNDRNFVQARGSDSACWNISKAKWTNNRLQVFRNITPDSPRT
ncbi:uncharacterized protein LOC122639479 [Telopea speciosissima]|uniref:uncharacterized protein LOC122639479 n=1 Tax=Telopea speciosissima TaxID=54955 RepID=UPI001CC5266E|nr:uncharacterized protein LOC122639479 [Telopea speciosissima]